jgi:hypothetical protein
MYPPQYFEHFDTKSTNLDVDKVLNLCTVNIQISEIRVNIREIRVKIFKILKSW